MELCILSVQEAIQNIDAEIIVIDNNSKDDSCAMVKARFPDVKLIENDKNLGFPKGNNIGVEVAQGEYICILNPDTVVAEDCLIKILAFAERQKNLGIVGCKLVDGSGKFLPESKRGIPTPFVAFTKISGLYKIFPKTFGKYYAQHLSENQTGKVEILVGAFMLLKRDLYTKIGGFDENCFMYSDDIDLSYLALKEGKQNFYFHETTVIHYKGESTVKDASYMKRFQEAMNFFYKKHFRVSPLFTFFMEIGIVFFSIIKRFQGQAKSKLKPQKYILISSDNSLKSKLELKLKSEMEIQSFGNFNVNPNTATEIIFDQNQINFKTIIQKMESLKNPKISFRIIPKSSQFLIGSNNSFERGEIINF